MANISVLDGLWKLTALVTAWYQQVNMFASNADYRSKQCSHTNIIVEFAHLISLAYIQQ